MSKENENYDFINPTHYQLGNGKETFDLMVDTWGMEKAIAHCEMCAFKYRMRMGKKPDQPVDRDMKKVEWYESKASELRNKIQGVELAKEGLRRVEDVKSGIGNWLEGGQNEFWKNFNKEHGQLMVEHFYTHKHNTKAIERRIREAFGNLATSVYYSLEADEDGRQSIIISIHKERVISIANLETAMKDRVNRIISEEMNLPEGKVFNYSINKKTYQITVKFQKPSSAFFEPLLQAKHDHMMEKIMEEHGDTIQSVDHSDSISDEGYWELKVFLNTEKALTPQWIIVKDHIVRAIKMSQENFNPETFTWFAETISGEHAMIVKYKFNHKPTHFKSDPHQKTMVSEMMKVVNEKYSSASVSHYSTNKEDEFILEVSIPKIEGNGGADLRKATGLMPDMEDIVLKYIGSNINVVAIGDNLSDPKSMELKVKYHNPMKR